MKKINSIIIALFIILILVLFVILIISAVMGKEMVSNVVRTINGTSTGTTTSRGTITNPQGDTVVISGQTGRVQLPPIPSRGLNVIVTSRDVTLVIPASNAPIGTTIVITNNSGSTIGVTGGTGVVITTPAAPGLDFIPIGSGVQSILTSIGNNRYSIR